MSKSLANNSVMTPFKRIGYGAQCDIKLVDELRFKNVPSNPILSPAYSFKYDMFLRVMNRR